MISRLLETYARAFAGLPRGVWHLALVTVVHRSGTMVLPFLSLYVTRDLGLTPRHAGAALALYGADLSVRERNEPSSSRRHAQGARPTDEAADGEALG